MFMRSRSRRDIHISVSLLTTRYKRHDADDWEKLKRVLNYTKGTKHTKLKLRVESVSVVNC